MIIREPIKKESGYTNKGNYNNKLCWLTYEVDNGKYILDFLREILKKYPILISDLQKNDKIIDIIVTKTSHSDYFNKLNVKEFLTTFRKMLSSSPSFFENCFADEFFLIKYYEISFKTDQHHLNETESLAFWALALFAFKHCVINDSLKGVSTEEALNIVRIHNNSVLPGDWFDGERSPPPPDEEFY